MKRVPRQAAGSTRSDLVAELFEAADVVATDPVRVAAVEVVGAEVLVRHAVLEHVPQGHEHRVLHGRRSPSWGRPALSGGGRARGSSSSSCGPPPRPPLARSRAARWRPCRWWWAGASPRSHGCPDTAAPRRRSARPWETGPCPPPSRPGSPARRAWPRPAWSAPTRRPSANGAMAASIRASRVAMWASSVSIRARVLLEQEGVVGGQPRPRPPRAARPASSGATPGRSSASWSGIVDAGAQGV